MIMMMMTSSNARSRFWKKEGRCWTKVLLMFYLDDRMNGKESFLFSHHQSLCLPPPLLLLHRHLLHHHHCHHPSPCASVGSPAVGRPQRSLTFFNHSRGRTRRCCLLQRPNHLPDHRHQRHLHFLLTFLPLPTLSSRCSSTAWERAPCLTKFRHSCWLVEKT